MSRAPLRLMFDVQGDLMEAAKQCEADVFSSRFGDTAEEIADGYRKYESDTHFVAVVDQDDLVLATARLVFPGPGGLPGLDDLAGPPWSVEPEYVIRSIGMDLERTVDCATFAVRDGLRRQGSAASFALLHGVFAAMSANRMDCLIAVIDSVAHSRMDDVGLVFAPIPGTSTQPFYGSKASTPLYARMDEVLATQKRLSPAAHRLIVLGIGLDGVEVPAAEEFRLR